jgi:hypothetical protein
MLTEEEARSFIQHVVTRSFAISQDATIVRLKDMICLIEIFTKHEGGGIDAEKQEENKVDEGIGEEHNRNNS